MRLHGHGLADWYRRTGMAELTGRRLRGAGDRSEEAMEDAADLSGCYVLRALEDGGDRRSWGSVRRALRTHCYTTILLPTRAGTTHRIRRAGEPDEQQKAIYRLLDIDWTSLPVLRTVTGTREVPSLL